MIVFHQIYLKKLDPFSGKGINKSGSKVTPKPYCGAKKTPKGRYLGDWEECKNQVRYYGLEKINPEILNKWEQERKAKTTKARNVKKVVSKENIKKMKELAKKKKELKHKNS